jgi:hypothetical protein
MQRNQCEEGIGLDKAYMEKTRIWISAEADKRVAIGVNRAVGVNEWHDIARRADDAKTGHKAALGEYIDHTINCPRCRTRAIQ